MPLRPWIRVALRLAAVVPTVAFHALAFIPIHEFGHCALGWAAGSEAPCSITYDAPQGLGDSLAGGGDMAKASGGVSHEGRDHAVLFPVQILAAGFTTVALAIWAANPLKGAR